MLELKIKQGRRYVPIFDLPNALGRQNAYREIGDTVENLIAFLDEIDGDTDLELEDGAGETVAVIDDPELPPEEDDGDPDLEEIGAEDSFMEHRHGDGPGCNIADPDCGVDDQGEGIDEREPEDDIEHTNYGIDQTKPPLSPYLTNDASLRRPFIQRARREACVPLSRPNVMGCTFELVEI